MGRPVPQVCSGCKPSLFTAFSHLDSIDRLLLCIAFADRLVPVWGRANLLATVLAPPRKVFYDILFLTRMNSQDPGRATQKARDLIEKITKLQRVMDWQRGQTLRLREINKPQEQDGLIDQTVQLIKGATIMQILCNQLVGQCDDEIAALEMEIALMQ